MSHDQPHPDDERVSRLLADARHTEPLPPEVAARLDRTLEGLAEERRTPARSVAPVVDLPPPGAGAAWPPAWWPRPPWWRSG